MTREERKATYERGVFERFLDASGVPVKRVSLIQGRAAQNEPDLIGELISGERVGFELGRLIDPILAEAMNRRALESGAYIRTSDPSRAIARKKIKQTYSVPFPVELVLYTEDPIITPDDVIIPTIRPVCRMRHKYRRVWFMGDSVETLYERS
jgi:hypothetical protein